MSTGADDYFSIEGPVELHGDLLALRIPLNVGGEQLASIAPGTSFVEDGVLTVVLEQELVERLILRAGDRVVVDCFNGTFNVTRSGELAMFEGPIERHGEEVAVLVPLDGVGEKLAPMTTRIGKVENGRLIIVIPPWMLEKLRIGVGSLLVVHNRNGLFNLTRSSANDV